MHISLDSALGRQRRLNSVGESVLQIAPDAAAAYSLRSLTGGDPNVVRVRRESDNTEKDFSGSQIESGEMANWVGAGNDGYVQTWYDQSGSGNDAEQTTAANQPKIVGTDFLGAIDFDGTSDNFSNTTVDFGNGDFSVFTCYTPPTNNFDGILLGTSDGKWPIRILYNAITLRDTNSVIYSIPLDENMTANKRYIISVIRSGTSITAYIDGVAQTNVKTVSASNEFRFDRVGVRGASSQRLEGEVRELVVYPEDQTQNREAIETNISNAFPKNLDVFLLLGQSNMVGFPSDNYPPTSYLSNSNDSKVWVASSAGTSSNDAGDLVDNSVAYDTEGLIRLDTYAAQSRFGYGPNLDFARTLVNDHNYDNLGIIKWARNGTALDVYWKKEANKFYPTVVSYCNEQINSLKTKFIGYNVKVAGFIWLQGHGDSTVQSRAEAYETNLTQLVEDLRADIDSAANAQIIIARSPDFWKLPFETGEPGADAQKVTNVDTIKTAQQNIAENDGNGLWVNTDDLDYFEPWVSGVAGNNPVHFTTDAKQSIGIRLANAVVTLTNYT